MISIRKTTLGRVWFPLAFAGLLSCIQPNSSRYEREISFYNPNKHGVSRTKDTPISIYKEIKTDLDKIREEQEFLDISGHQYGRVKSGVDGMPLIIPSPEYKKNVPEFYRN